MNFFLQTGPEWFLAQVVERLTEDILKGSGLNPTKGKTFSSFCFLLKFDTPLVSIHDIFHKVVSLSLDFLSLALGPKLHCF